MDRAFRKRENASFSYLFAGEAAAPLTACGYAAGVISVLLAVCPLKQDIEQEVTSKNAKCQKHRQRHKDLARTGVHA